VRCGLRSECENPSECVGPYGPSGMACCEPCAIEHDELPRPMTCKCDDCALKRSQGTMTVGELRSHLDSYEDSHPVLLQGPSEELWPLHPCLGEADEGAVVVIMAATRREDRGDS